MKNHLKINNLFTSLRELKCKFRHSVSTEAILFIFLTFGITAQQCFAAMPIKEEGPNPIVKFLAAMAGVLVSALAIFLGLKFYNKFILKNDSKSENIDYNKTLESPKDFKEAINIFLDKTDR